MMKTYHGYAATKEHAAQVVVRNGSLRKLEHHVRHSPTGFSWGFGGSGPGDLARCILLDTFGMIDCPDAPKECQCESKWVEPAYHAFKDDVVAKLSQESDWKLQQVDVANWVFDFLLDDNTHEVEEEREPVKV